MHWPFLSSCRLYRPHLSLSTSALRDSLPPTGHHLSPLVKFKFLVNLHALVETSGLLIGISRSFQTVGSDIIKALDEIKEVADIQTVRRQNSEESFDKIMDAGVKIVEDMNTAVDKSRSSCEAISLPRSSSE